MVNPLSIRDSHDEWRQLAEAGGAEAERYARRCLAGCARAVDRLVINLSAIGYPSIPGRVPPEINVDEVVANLESQLQDPLPTILKLFWETVGGISLVDFDGYRHVDFWDSHDVEGPNGYSDGVVVEAYQPDWVDMVLSEHDALQDDPDVPADDTFLICLAPDGYHKDDISGGAPYGLQVGDGWLAPWLHFRWSGAAIPTSAQPGSPDLLGYLRTSILECAGFPGLFGVAEFEPFRVRLLDGIEGF
ncbi:MAG: hypothetical protein R3F15_11280 [Lysobacterales bacterium]